MSSDFPPVKERKIVFANPPPEKKEPEIVYGREKPEEPSPRMVTRPGDREPTTYHQLADRPDDFDQRVTNAIPRITSRPWAGGLDQNLEPPSDVGHLCGNTVGEALGGASPSKSEDPPNELE
jgi:hypothetical protein